ncbi:hypothetical protein [Brevibacillus massiliensis]|uniref:hypothetical protein n=1 Tax=Brevibacillus massiliensis TaxID=1118054 RepID=UPI0002FBEE76|nr:hypothetical protein [Brevibacillus massiliensis]
MTLKQTITVYEAMDSMYASGHRIKELFAPYADVQVDVDTVAGEKGKTDFVKILIPGKNGKTKGSSRSECWTG